MHHHYQQLQVGASPQTCHHYHHQYYVISTSIGGKGRDMLEMDTWDTWEESVDWRIVGNTPRRNNGTGLIYEDMWICRYER